MLVWATFGKKILGVLLQNWKLVLICGFIGFVYYLHQVKIPNLEQQLVIADKNLVICTTSNTELKNSISQFNEQVEDWKQISNQLQQQNNKLAGELMKMRETVNKQTADILNAKTPPTCKASIEFLKNIGKLQW